MSVVSAIDRSLYEPPYAQLARLLRERIARGEYRPGDRLPSEAELCATYRVSPMTVRRAVTLLVQEEVATTEQGRGTFVKSPKLGAATFDLSDLRRYLDDSATAVTILEARIVSASARVSSKLAVGEGARVIAIKRLLSREDELIFYHSEYLVFDPAWQRRRGPQVRPSHTPCISLHGKGSGLSGRKGGHAGLGRRASLLRL
jgi:GntR family transcriptional regulator